MEKFDLIIAGGGTSGCACAYIAGKLGLKVLLIESKIHLGGSITSALVVPTMQTSENQINTEFFEALTHELQNLNGQVTYQSNKGWFNPELTKLALDNLMKQANVKVLLNTNIKSLSYTDNFINSIILDSKILSVPIESKYFVEATGNCEISQKLNCEFLEENYQSSSLRFQMSGIDLEKFSNWLIEFDSDRNVTTVEKINGEIHLSTACTSTGNWSLMPIFKQAVEEGILQVEDCEYFQIFTVAGMKDTVNFNCPRINNVNPLNPIEVTNALITARKAILRLANFCKKYLIGFENAYISNIADEFGVRVSRRIKGKYIYTKEDLISGKTFETPVLIGNYPIDIHSASNSKLEKVTQDYQLPIEALMSADFENLFIIGRGLSADFEAQAALRIQPACFSMGEGVARFIANQRD